MNYPHNPFYYAYMPLQYVYCVPQTNNFSYFEFAQENPNFQNYAAEEQIEEPLVANQGSLNENQGRQNEEKNDNEEAKMGKIRIEKQLIQTQTRNKRSMERKSTRQFLEPVKYDRNIYSNALKLLLKHVRFDSIFSGCKIQKIIRRLQVAYSVEKFIQDLNNKINPDLNYIRPCLIQEICTDTQNQQFSKVFRIYLREFFTKEIFTLSYRPTRTNKSVRKEQIRAGRKLIDQLFNS